MISLAGGAKNVFFFLLLNQIVIAHFRRPPSLQGQRLLHEKAALLAFKSKLTLQSQLFLANWNESTSVCLFIGVNCRRHRYHDSVVRLELNDSNLFGPLSPVLANLTGLEELDLANNFLTGNVPHELSNLRNLSTLYLSGNRLTGTIPSSLAFLTSLQYLNLGSNLLQGQIPDSIFINCTRLGVIDLSNNSLTGIIPSNVEIYLPYLITLNLYSNNLTGKLPLWLSNSSFLWVLDVENNKLVDELPTTILKNKFYLETLHLSDNNFSSHDGNTNLGPFFLALSNCTSLSGLEIAGLGVGGALPRSVGTSTRSLSIVNMEDNFISGHIPPDIQNLSSLTVLNLSGNLLKGTIPDEICQLPMLGRLILSGNLLTGSIPLKIGNISSLDRLDLSINRLTGEIPKSLSKLFQINELDLQRNQLSGSIPVELGGYQSINKLDLSYNMLTGPIPQQIASTSVKISFSLSNNQLQGSLPLELSKMVEVQEIDLSSNNLTGEILPQFSDCLMLRLLNLSNNQLTGELPAQLGSFRDLETLDLSSNQLEGQIPLSFEQCTKLVLLNLSYNNFHGWIPTAGVFSTFTNLSYLGNPHLCGHLSSKGKACHERKRWYRTWKLLVVIAVGASFSAFILTISLVIIVQKIRRVVETRGDSVGGRSPPAVGSSYPRITYRELVEATAGFDEGRLLGSGSYGRVYRGTLRDGTVVAVKVLNVQSGNSTRSFNRECQALKTIRHRNLMRIITACSLPEFKALVLPFMANGSLESRLYSSSDEEHLSLIQRVNICSDVAEGMAYLHHHSPVKVIHCDLKPSNVLLNDDFTALVSDFGIARLLMSVGAGNTTENVGSSTANMLSGSIGYIAPEYGYGSYVSTKGDVYSFGVLVLEVATRKRPTDEMFEGGTNLHTWVKRHYHGSADLVVDPALAMAVRDQTPEVKRMTEAAIGELLELGLLCTQENPAVRPTMADAADDLDRLKRYLDGDTSRATFTSSLAMSSSTFGENSFSCFDD